MKGRGLNCAGQDRAHERKATGRPGLGGLQCLEQANKKRSELGGEQSGNAVVANRGRRRLIGRGQQHAGLQQS